MIPAFDTAAGWLQETLLLPLLFQLGLVQWEDISFGWALFAIYGAAQVLVTFAVCVPLEHWRPVERWPDAKAVVVDVLYTFISRVGLLPLITFVLFFKLQVELNGFLTDMGWGFLAIVVGTVGAVWLAVLAMMGRLNGGS